MTATPDLLIAGGGPAGLAAALFARQQGLSVTVIEPKAGTIDKACGEGLMPAAVSALAELGVTLPVSHPFFGVRYLAGEYAAEGRFWSGTGLGVRRTVLHAALADQADRTGVVREEGRVQEVSQDADGVSVGPHRARYLLAADGLHSPLRRSLGLDLPARRPRRLGVRRHFGMAP